MNILVLNGSPKDTHSNTMNITHAFLQGINENNLHNVEIVSIKHSRIEHCLGCFICWTEAPGQCVIKDDMSELIEKYIYAELIIWSFPLYYFGMPSKIKAFLDRLLPTNLPWMIDNPDGTSGHPPRYDLSSQRHLLISTCGFHTIRGNYDALLHQFDIFCGERLTKIICPEGELFSIPQLVGRTAEYLNHVTNAGKEYDSHGRFSEQTTKHLSELLFPPKVFIEMANASWHIADTENKSNFNKTISDSKSADQSHRFMRQMAAIYNPATYQKDTVIELYFSDLEKTYQLVLERESCALKTEPDISQTYTTRIETPFAVWQDISAGKINGAQAMMEKKYKVSGDFTTMLKMDDYFRVGSSPQKHTDSKLNKQPLPKTNMSILLLQWISLWVLLPISPLLGSSISIGICSLLPLLSTRYQLTIYDRISGTIVSLLSVFALSGAVSLHPINETIIVCLSYFLFGLLWLGSCVKPVPLSAYYSNKDYGYEQAFSNPLFIKTNRIITAAWGLLYLVIAGYSYFLLISPIAPYTGLINSVAPALMGVFTVWFAQWYPARVAGG